MSSGTQTGETGTKADRPTGKEGVSPLRRALRWLAIFSVPVLLLGGGAWLWLHGGRFIETEDAYLKRDKVMIAPEVSGRIVEVAVGENDSVARADLLFALDPEPYRIALAKADAELDAARVRVEEARTRYRAALAALTSAEAAAKLARQTFRRQEALLKRGNTSQSRYDEAATALQRAEQEVIARRHRLAEAKAALGGDPSAPIDAHPWVRKARARRDRAAWELARTRIRAPSAGRISQTGRLLVGSYVPAGLPVVSLVKESPVWIEANYKETQITHMRPGQPARLVIDAWPMQVLRGHVESIGWGTGAEFSLLPPQNATGNWVKVVQRVPVRIVLDDPLPEDRVRSGLSVRVTVDTGVTIAERWRLLRYRLGLTPARDSGRVARE